MIAIITQSQRMHYESVSRGVVCQWVVEGCCKHNWSTIRMPTITHFCRSRFCSSGACLTGIVIQILPYDDDIMLISDTPEGLERHLNALKVFCFEFYTYFDLTFKGPQSLREAVVLDFLVDMQPLVLLKDSVHNCSSKNNELNCGYSIHLSHQI